MTRTRIFTTLLVTTFLATLFSAPSAHAVITLPNCLTPGAAFKNQPCEIQRTSAATFASASAAYVYFKEATATLTFPAQPTRPAMKIKGFFDGRNGAGNAIIKFRISAPVDGTWNYSIVSDPVDAGIGASGSFGVAASSSPGFLRRDNTFPTRVVRDNNTYPWIWGNTYYQLISKVVQGTPNWQDAITNSMTHGMTKFRLLVWPWWGATAPGANDGQGLGNYVDTQPYTATVRQSPNYQNVNLAHVRALDDLMLYLYNQGAFVELIIFHDQASNTADPIPSRTFGRDPLGNFDIEVSKKYATYAVARYGAFPNVYFTLSQEWQNAYNNQAWWNTMGDHVKASDGHYTDYNATPNRVRLLSIHPNQGPTPAFGFSGSTWASYAQLQWSWRQKPLSTPPDQYGNQSITTNLGLNIPVFNDEFGYLAELQDQATGDLFTREESRQAMWGVVMGGGYGTVGDANDSSGSDITITSDWVDRAMYDDVQRMRDFFVSTVGNFHRLVSASLTGLVSGQTGSVRVYALRQASSRFVFYKANSGTFNITLPTSKTWTITKIDLTNPMAAAVTTTFVGQTTTLGTGDTNDWAYYVR